MTGKERLRKLIDERLPLDSTMRAAVEEGIVKMSEEEAALHADELEAGTASLRAGVAAMEDALAEYAQLVVKFGPKD